MLVSKLRLQERKRFIYKVKEKARSQHSTLALQNRSLRSEKKIDRLKV